MRPRDFSFHLNPVPNLVPRSLLLVIASCHGCERQWKGVCSKSSIIDMLNNEFDRAAYLKYEQTESLLFFYVTYQIQSSFKFNYIACTKSSNQYTLTSSKHFFPFSKVLIWIPTREFWKVFKDEIKMVIQVILKWKTTSSVTEDFAKNELHTP